MNENIDLTKILKDCPKDWKFWSPILGEVEFERNYGNNGSININSSLIPKNNGYYNLGLKDEALYYVDKALLYNPKSERLNNNKRIFQEN